MDNVCVFGSSSDAIDPIFLEESYKLGGALADAGYGLVFGAGRMGVMGASARGMHSKGGKVIGVLPKFMDKEGIPYTKSDEMILTDTMRERKCKMEELSNAFVTAAGGVGTYEEFFEILTLKQLRQHSKAMVILNTKGYYDEMLDLLKHTVEERFAKDTTLELYRVTSTVEETVDYLKNYTYEDPGEKWFR